MRDVLDRPTPPGTRPTRVAPGTVLRGRYEVGPLLGRGGMAEVYVAHDRVLDRSVAVKVLRGPLASDPVAEAGFVREARAAASLAHPNIVAVYDAGTEGQISFLVMELVRGQPLSELLARTGPLEPERAAAIVAAMADALASAHD